MLQKMTEKIRVKHRKEATENVAESLHGDQILTRLVG